MLNTSTMALEALSRVEHLDNRLHYLEQKLKENDGERALVLYSGEPPSRGHATDAGLDLCLAEDTVVDIFEMTKLVLQTRVLIPEGYMGQLTLRSSMTARGLIGHVGTIDAGYTGKLQLPVGNTTGVPIRLKKGSRVAQLVILKLASGAVLRSVDNFEETPRGEGGFGSTGEN